MQMTPRSRSYAACVPLSALLCAALLLGGCVSAPAAQPAPVASTPVPTVAPTPAQAETPACVMPDFQYDTAHYAIRELNACSADVELVYDSSGSVPAGLVLSQSLAVGKAIAPGEKVSISVSLPTPQPTPTPTPTPKPRKQETVEEPLYPIEPYVEPVPTSTPISADFFAMFGTHSSITSAPEPCG